MSTLLLTLMVLSHPGDVLSGPRVGDKTPPFKVLAFSGPDAGKEVEWPGGKKEGPTMVIFVHEMTRPLLQLLRPVDRYAATLADGGLQTRIVWLSPDKGKAEEFLKRAKDSLNLQSPVGITLDGAEGPEKYGLNNMAKVTILVADKGAVVANFAFSDPNLKDATKVTAAVAKVLGKKPPTAEELK